MKKSVAALLVFLSLAVLCTANGSPVKAQSGDSWVEKAPMPTARDDLGVAVVNGKVYAIGGYRTNPFAFLAVNEEYDPATDTWTTKAPMPTPRASCAVAVCENQIYVIGGQIAWDTGAIVSTYAIEAYDPSTDTWTTKASIPTSEVLGNMGCANVVDDKIYYMSLWGTLNEVYDPATDSWAPKAPRPSGVSISASAAMDDKIYVITWSGFNEPSLTQIYDTKTNVWTSGASIPIHVHHVVGAGYSVAAGATTGVVALKAIYVIGGSTAYSTVGSQFVQVYYPKTDSWGMGAPMPTARDGLGVAVVNDMLFAIGGANSYAREPRGLLVGAGLTNNELYMPIGYGTRHTVLVFSVVQSASYNTSVLPLHFAAIVHPAPVAWTGYSLDGQTNVTVAGYLQYGTFFGNATLSGLSDGWHTLRVYATNEYGETAASQLIDFKIETQAPQPMSTSTPSETEIHPTTPFPTTLVAVAVAVIVAVVCFGLAAYFLRRKGKGSET